jgi:hypothetical protein
VKDIYKIAEALTTEVYEGISHLDICRGMQGIDPIVGNRAPTFFMQSFFAHLYAAQMYAVKLFDTSKTSITVPRFLEKCRRHASEFQDATPSEVLQYVAEAKKTIDGFFFASTLKTLKNRRNQYLAHISPELVFDRKRLSEGPKLQFGEIRRVLLKGGRIVNQLSIMWCGKSNQILNTRTDDYKVVVEMMHKQIKIETDEHEAEAKRHGYDLKIPRTEPID